MQNIVEICKELGIEVADTDALTKKVAENYVTRAEHEKKIGKVEADRDKFKEQAQNAEKTLEGFEGIDPAQIKTELETWKTKAENAKNEYEEKLRARDLNDKAREKMAELSVQDDMADFIFNEIMDTGVSLNASGDLIGWDEGVKAVRNKRASAFINEAENNKARIVEPMQSGNGSKPMTKEDILAIADTSQRQAAIAQNLDLFT